jgi:hypothetical protein
MMTYETYETVFSNGPTRHLYRHPDDERWYNGPPFDHDAYDEANTQGAKYTPDCVAFIEPFVPADKPASTRAWTALSGGEWSTAEVTAREVTEGQEKVINVVRVIMKWSSRATTYNVYIHM